MVVLFDQFGKPLSLSQHNSIEHTIGEEIPAPTLVKNVIGIGPAELGSSSIPAREDHRHGDLNNTAGNTVFYSEASSQITGIVAITFLPGLATTGLWTAVANRRYEVSVKVEILQTVASDVWVMNLIDQTVPVVLQRTVDANGSVTSPTKFLHYVTTTSISGAKDWRISLERVGGTGTLSAPFDTATSPAFILIKDIGPL